MDADAGREQRTVRLQRRRSRIRIGRTYIWSESCRGGVPHRFSRALGLVAAIPVTIIYKAAAPGEVAPFPDGDPFTEGLLAAKNWSDIQAQFLVAPQALHAEAALAAFTAADDPVMDEAKLKTPAEESWRRQWPAFQQRSMHRLSGWISDPLLRAGR